jgi:hypothetical protein
MIHIKTTNTMEKFECRLNRIKESSERKWGMDGKSSILLFPDCPFSLVE